MKSLRYSEHKLSLRPAPPCPLPASSLPLPASCLISSKLLGKALKFLTLIKFPYAISLLEFTLYLLGNVGAVDLLPRGCSCLPCVEPVDNSLSCSGNWQVIIPSLLLTSYEVKVPLPSVWTASCTNPAAVEKPVCNKFPY